MAKLNKLSILVVEDTEPMRKLLVSVLRALGVEDIFEAAEGAEGFQMFCEHNPDLVIADWEMQPINGLDLTLDIRQNPQSPNRMVPIILVTGYNAMSRVARARDAGVTEFLVKPFSAEDLAKRLGYVINAPRDFVSCTGYFGPDRRRYQSAHYDGPKRRVDDHI